MFARASSLGPNTSWPDTKRGPTQSPGAGLRLKQLDLPHALFLLARFEFAAGQCLAQEWRGPAALVLCDFLRRAKCDDFASVFAGFRPDIDDVISFSNDAQIMFNDDNGLAIVDEAMQDFKQLGDVGHVQADGRFFKQV